MTSNPEVSLLLRRFDYHRIVDEDEPLRRDLRLAFESVATKTGIDPYDAYRAEIDVRIDEIRRIRTEGGSVSEMSRELLTLVRNGFQAKEKAL